MPMTVAAMPADGLLVFWIIVWIKPAAWSPTAPLIWDMSCPWTAWRPNTRPAMPIPITNSGAIEKMV